MSFNYLQHLIDNTPRGGRLDLSGQLFFQSEPTTITKRIHIVGGDVRVGAPFSGAVISFDVLSAGSSINGTEITGAGRTDEQMVGINVAVSQVSVRDCRVDDIEYALYFFDSGSDGSRLIDCYGEQDKDLFPEPWKGLDYGVVTQNTSDIQIRGCNIVGTRHAVVFGHGSKDCILSDSVLRGTADVQTVALKPEYNGKPPAERCTIKDCCIIGGINLGGLRTRVVNNNIIGRTDQPQPSIALYAPSSTIADLDHEVTGNLLQVNTVTGSTASAQYGAVYAWAGSYVGSPIFTNNRIVIDGAAPAVVGVTGPLDVVDEGVIRDLGNVVHRS